MRPSLIQYNITGKNKKRQLNRKFHNQPIPYYPPTMTIRLKNNEIFRFFTEQTNLLFQIQRQNLKNFVSLHNKYIAGTPGILFRNEADRYLGHDAVCLPNNNKLA